MKYTTLVIAALLGYAQAVTIRDDNEAALEDNGSEVRRAPAPKRTVKGFPGKDSSDSDSDDDKFDGFFRPNDVRRGDDRMNAPKLGDFNG